MFHAERIKDPGLQEVGEGSGDNRQDHRQHQTTHAAVRVLRSARKIWSG
jgi:hypothetical protein